jgi:hypothetical protein
MIDSGARCLVTLALAVVVVVLSGCSKKEEPPTPAKVSTTADTAAKETATQTADAAGQEQGVPAMDATSIMSSVDKNGDGKVTREEYFAIWKDKSVADRNFKMIDRNGDGVLSMEEFRPKLGTK